MKHPLSLFLLSLSLPTHKILLIIFTGNN